MFWKLWFFFSFLVCVFFSSDDVFGASLVWALCCFLAITGE